MRMRGNTEGWWAAEIPLARGEWELWDPDGALRGTLFGEHDAIDEILKPLNEAFLNREPCSTGADA